MTEDTPTIHMNVEDVPKLNAMANALRIEAQTSFDETDLSENPVLSRAVQDWYVAKEELREAREKADINMLDRAVKDAKEDFVKALGLSPGDGGIYRVNQFVVAVTPEGEPELKERTQNQRYTLKAQPKIQEA